MASFFSLYIGRSGLQAQMAATEVTGQNIANANTPGYTRQVARMESVVPSASPGARMTPGQGVRISDVDRIKSEYYTDQLINSTANKSYWQTRQNALEGIEVNFLEPGESGINTYLNDYWNAWQELSANPESSAVRMGLQDKAVSLTRGVQNTYLGLEDLKQDIYSELETKVTQVNKIAEEVAAINEQLVFLSATGDKSNELLDQLDRCVKELSELVDVRVRTTDSGAVEIFAGGRLLVQQNRSFEISVSGDEDGMPQITGPQGQEYSFNSGSIRALQEAHNEVIPGYQEELNTLVTSLVDAVNAAHSEGKDLYGNAGENFFREIDADEHPPALYFEVNENIMDDYNLIAAADDADGMENGESGEGDEATSGDGSNALAIARLRDENIVQGETTTDEFLRGMVGRLGVEGQESERMYVAFNEVTRQLEQRQEAISGVSLDDEMLNMVRYQHAYNAAAKFMATADQMIALMLTELG